MRLNEMLLQDGLCDNELYWGCTCVISCQSGSIMKGRGTWEPQFESTECKVCARGGRCSCASSAVICGRDVHPSECTALHAVSASFKMFKGDFVQLINGPCGTIKITADHETRSLKMGAIQTVWLSIISLMKKKKSATSKLWKSWFCRIAPFCSHSAFFPLTNLWLLLVMVAGEQVGNGAGPQRSNEGTSVIGHLGLLPNHHLQQYDTSQLPWVHIRRIALHKHLSR